ncbi:hypothetical protein MN608_01547 [Microdochium nivale]|nr:hypothetical protein MN608_01547 [Microdochium nivale]
MLPHRILAALSLAASSVSAIDLRFFSNNNCRSSTWLACNSWNPGPCCYTTSEEYSVGGGFFAVPISWRIVCQVWQTRGCDSGGALRATGLSYGRDSICFTAPVDRQRGYAEGLSYYFNGKKRGVGQDSTECQRANILHLDDDSEYDLAELSDAAYNDVVSSPVRI